MAFTATDLFPGIIATHASGFTGAHGLAVQNGRARFRIATRCLPHLFSQRVMDPLPRSFATPGPEIVIHGAPGWKVMRQQFPSTSTAHGIENAVEDFAAAVLRR